MKSMKSNSQILALLSFIFINIFFYRISEHGTDRSAQILFFYYSFIYLKYLKIKKMKKRSVFYFNFIYTYYFIKIFLFFIHAIVNSFVLFFVTKKQEFIFNFKIIFYKRLFIIFNFINYINFTFIFC